MPIGPAVWQIPQTFECLTPKTPSALCLEGQFVWRISIPDGSADVCQFWGQSSSRLTASPNFWICGTNPLPPPPRNATWGIEGRLVFSLCPFPDESADVNQSWCQSDSSPDFWIVDSLNPPPPSAPLASPWAICLAYIDSHDMNVHMCAKFGANRPSRLVAFPEFVLRLVRLFAAVHADSRKNTPKNNNYTSKIIIPARTCRHQRH